MLILLILHCYVLLRPLPSLSASKWLHDKIGFMGVIAVHGTGWTVTT